jgi:hypothetical protein
MLNLLAIKKNLILYLLLPTAVTSNPGYVAKHKIPEKVQ